MKHLGVIEVRMNPSVLPVTIANWMHIKKILPELSNTYYTLTLNRQEQNDFSWEDPNDVALLPKLKGLGLMAYAATMKNVFEEESSGDFSFGEMYLGQTVRKIDDEYDYTGLWGGNQGKHGQLAIYSGFGDNFPLLAYYLAMSATQPEILDRYSDLLSNLNRPSDALAQSRITRRKIFSYLHNRIASDTNLSRLKDAFDTIVTTLKPQNG